MNDKQEVMELKPTKVLLIPEVLREAGWMQAEEHKKILKRFANDLVEFTGHRQAVVWVARAYGVDMEGKE